VAFIPIKVADLRVGLFVTLEGSKEDNPFSEKEFKIQSSITLAVLKEMPHVRIFFDPALSDLEPEIVGSLHDTIEQDTSGDQPITVADSFCRKFSPGLFRLPYPSKIATAESRSHN